MSGGLEDLEMGAAVGAVAWKIWRCRNDVVFNNEWRPDVACNVNRFENK